MRGFGGGAPGARGEAKRRVGCGVEEDTSKLRLKVAPGRGLGEGAGRSEALREAPFLWDLSRFLQRFYKLLTGI